MRGHFALEPDCGGEGFFEIPCNMSSYKISKLYHPSHRVPSLEIADKFFADVFGHASIWRSKIFPERDPKYPDFPTDYCIFTPIADVFFDCIDPTKYIIDGEQRYATLTKPELNGFGWGVEGIDEIYTLLNEAGIRCTDQANRPSDPKECPVASFNTSKLFYTDAETSGIRYEFYPTASIGHYDHRKNPAWRLHPETEKGPLGILYCSHHTILTNRLDRALKFYVNILGGTVIHEETNTLRGTNSTFVGLADAVFELAVPTESGTYAMEQMQGRQRSEEDIYHALTWRVRDLGQVQEHLNARGVSIMLQNEKMIVVDPENGLGIAWGFVVDSIPSDHRLREWSS